jgi:hypothetical protein
MRCINIDWLQVFGTLGISPDIIEGALTVRGYKVKNNDRGTRHFKKWFTVYKMNDIAPFIQLCFDPYSVKGKDTAGIFHPGACTVQLCNKWLYSPNPVEQLRSFCREIDMEYKALSRLDLCMDFQYFDNGMKPSNLIRGFYTVRYWKVGQIKALGVGKQHNEYDPETLSFSGKKTAVSTKLYNKTKEMTEVKFKPYIHDSWNDCGLLNGKDVWRLEVSIKPDGKNMVNVNTGEMIAVKLSVIDSPEKVMNLFFIFALKYWRWKDNNGHTPKKNARELELFKVSSDIQVWKPVRITNHMDTDRTAKMLVNKLLDISEHKSLSPGERRQLENATRILSKIMRVDQVGYLKYLAERP